MFQIKIYIKVKSVNKRKPIINKRPFEIDDHITTANQLIEYIVRKNVQEFNRQKTDQPIFAFLTDTEIENMEQIGKIGFSDKKNGTLQDEGKAVENALQCFEDGIFRLLIGDVEAQYNQTIHLKENDDIVFIRLTMLAGRLW